MSLPVTSAERVAVEVHVAGLVQGVGFRPFLHRLAMRHGLGGAVRNAAGDVRIDLEGPAAEIEAFIRALTLEAPPLALIEQVTTLPAVAHGLTEFAILPSDDGRDTRQPVSPDVALCAACERELLDPGNRRFQYPFITCTDCGPRFTVIEAMPYDRERTSMRVFQQCPDCLREYHAPSDRRFHSESNSCSTCGPKLWLEGAPSVSSPPVPLSSEERGNEDPVARAAEVLLAGKIVAIRGLGGFHLAVDGTNETAVQRLRDRKHREAKPLAVMVRTLDDARELAAMEPLEEELLVSRERPIVLVRKKPGRVLAPSIAPALDRAGVMLAYTPLHHLLLVTVGRPLVMTSGNRSEEPIATSNHDARERLGDIADAFLMHDREIVARYDDSVVRVASGGRLFLRRARGYAPLPLDLPLETPRPLVAVGPHLKNTFTLAQGRRAFISQHIGDMESVETVEHFERTLDDYQRLFRIAPEIAVCDLHPEYLSTGIANELGLARVITVQHHHAHIAAVLAEHGRAGPVIGVAYDGTGYGDDGRIWGAEILVADLASYRRMAHLRYAPMPGGDLAARLPWRAARGYQSLEPAAAHAFARAFDDVGEDTLGLVDQQITARLNAPLASSMGRLFDAAAAVLGVRRESRYEGQAAMELEALAGDRPAPPLPFPVSRNSEGVWTLDPVPLLVALGKRVRAGLHVPELAAAFHESVAAATVAAVDRVAEATGLRIVALGGGVFQNARLLESLMRRLEHNGFEVLVPRLLSPNDGAISFGQAAVAAAQLRRESGG